MSENNALGTKSINKKTILGKGGPIAGSAISIIGNLFVLFGFVLPWASCSGYQLSGLDIVTKSASGELENANGTLLGLIPFLAIGMIGVAILTIPASLWKKISSLAKTIGIVLIAIMTACACLPSCLFFTNMQSARNDPNSFGFGGFYRVEYGFWITIFGLFVSFIGVFLGIGTLVAEMVMSKKKPAKTPETE